MYIYFSCHSLKRRVTIVIEIPAKPPTTKYEQNIKTTWYYSSSDCPMKMKVVVVYIFFSSQIYKLLLPSTHTPTQTNTLLLTTLQQLLVTSHHNHHFNAPFRNAPRCSECEVIIIMAARPLWFTAKGVWKTSLQHYHRLLLLFLFGGQGRIISRHY